MIGPPIQPFSRKDLEDKSGPSVAGQGEAVPWIAYDTELYTSAATVDLTFFATTKTDKTLSNMSLAGQFQTNQWMIIHNLGLDVLAGGTVAGAGTQVGIGDDIQKLMKVGRPIFTLDLNNKLYGPFPLRFLHDSGGAVGMGWGTFTAEDSVQIYNNGVTDGGWNWRGSIIIPPLTGFNITVHWAAAQTLAVGNINLAFWLAGQMTRMVV